MTASAVPRPPVPHGREHLAALASPLAELSAEVDRLERWGRHLASVLTAGGRLLALGNGGSAAQAQHLTSELVGRYRDDRPPFSAIALHAESSSLTAIANDYGYEEALARQVRAHGRPGDVLVALSTSGRSPNVLAAVAAARELGIVVWALTGPAPNPLQQAADDALSVDAATPTAQEVHQIAVHLLCAAFEHAVTPAPERASRRPARSERPIVVVGDALLDSDLEGRVERLCPDAPVPVVEDPARRSRPGGAALAAVLAARRRPVVLVTALGLDEAGREVAALLDDAGVELVDVGLAGATPQKVRVTTGGRPLVRLDHGGPPSPPGPLTDEARRALRDASAVLVSDYGRGLTGDAALRKALADRRAPVVWDPHPRGAEPVPGVRLATPNRAEAARFAPGVEGDGLRSLAVRAAVLGRRWRAAGIAVTLGADGAMLWTGGDAPLVVPATPVTGGDPCGAGDCFAATAAACLADGALPSEAVAEAVAAASAFVAGSRESTIDLRGVTDARPSTDLGAHADAVIRAVRARGGTVVATGGCFDLLHAGHVRMLAAARALGDCLVVCLNSDDSVRRLKGPDRPLVPEADRAGVLLALGAVDAVVVFNEDTPAAVLDRLRPDVFAKGGDYTVDSLPEATLVAGWGGQTVILPYVEGRSTTRILEEAVRRGR
ncbi:MAG TPA: D-glycero-beta-D-manno-heptose 1-phosphate adenylyltransferase [Acidimicrobiia bacterium]|nr:D-glycero-beta-D-manno-heptose 1-phosphate adenylyltransferase [Acidimicrobiia bacterium]